MNKLTLLDKNARLQKPDGTLTGCGCFQNQVSIAITVEVANACDVPFNAYGR
jgi:hypothetical protein